MNAVEFFLGAHAGVHSGDVSGRASYFDRALGTLDDAQMRARPGTGLNSVLWLLWHMARTEDACVAFVITDGQQVLNDDWAHRMNIPWRIIGTGMTEDEVADLTARADIAAVRAYRTAVGRRTRDVARTLGPDVLDEQVTFADTARAQAAGVFRENTGWIEGVGYGPWQEQSRAERLAGAAIRHNAMHLGEIVTVLGMIGKKAPL